MGEHSVSGFPWGNQAPTAERVNYKVQNLGETARVGGFEPNGYGLYDVAGNAFEWCSDWYDKTTTLILHQTILLAPMRGQKKF